MTENKRIFWNIVATYARSLFALGCGVFTSRWVLLSLGEVDYGLFGLIGGLTFFISFFNNVLGSAIGRFYSISVGRSRSAKDKMIALELCRGWFNTALTIHTILPLILMLIGYPLGIWGIHEFLTIPTDRIEDCVVLFRWVCFSCFVGMVSIPFTAMYAAKQYIAELTIYSYVTTAVNVCFLYYMVCHPGDWLCRYGAWSSCVAVLPQFIIMIRAVFIFQECRILPYQMLCWSKLKEVGSFACWQMIGIFSGLLRNQGMAIVINRFFGPKANASMSVGNSVNCHVNSLSGAMMGAFSPAIMSAYGAGDIVRMNVLVSTACRLGVLFSMFFAIPLIAEMDLVLQLWLVRPPVYAASMASAFLMINLVENSTWGYMVAVHATGKIALYNVAMGAVSLMAVPIAVVWALLGGAPMVALYAILITVIAYTVVRVVLANRIVGLSVSRWLRGVVVPLVSVFMITMFGAALPKKFMTAGTARLFIVVLIAECTLCVLSWHFLLSDEERIFVVNKLPMRIQYMIRRFFNV